MLSKLLRGTENAVKHEARGWGGGASIQGMKTDKERQRQRCRDPSQEPSGSLQDLRPKWFQ